MQKTFTDLEHYSIMALALPIVKPLFHTNMASIITLVLLVYQLALQAQGNMECEELSAKDCAFAVASSGARCVLEKQYMRKTGHINYKCQTSIIVAESGAMEWIETDACIRSCGLTRLWVGLSTDALLEHSFIQNLCSPTCKDHCPNIVDLFTKLAVEEGVYLPNVCVSLQEISKEKTSLPKTVTSTPRRELNEDKDTSSSKQSLQDFAGYSHPPFPSSFPHMVEPPYPLSQGPPYPYVQPPYPLPQEPPYPYVQPPYPYEPPYPHEHIEPPLPEEGEPFIFTEPPYPQAPYVAPYFIEPPYYQQPPNVYGESPYQQPPSVYGESPYYQQPIYNDEPPMPDFSSQSPIYMQPEPTLMAPNLPPSYVGGGF